VVPFRPTAIQSIYWGAASARGGGTLLASIRTLHTLLESIMRIACLTATKAFVPRRDPILIVKRSGVAY
jgi:hypothetical protein